MPRGLYLESRRAALDDRQRTMPSQAKLRFTLPFFISFLILYLLFFNFCLFLITFNETQYAPKLNLIDFFYFRFNKFNLKLI
jgi:hypothetical protein